MIAISLFSADVNAVDKFGIFIYITSKQVLKSVLFLNSGINITIIISRI